jgi:hypothetical protein
LTNVSMIISNVTRLTLASGDEARSGDAVGRF